MSVYFTAMFMAVGFGVISQQLTQQAAVADAAAQRRIKMRAARFAFLSGLVLTAVGALRWRVGTDYPNYVIEFPGYAAEPWRDYTLLSEPGLRLIAKFSAWVNDDYATMFAIAAVITIGLSVRTLYLNSTAFGLSILLFILTGPWLGSFNGVRQYLACAVIFAGHRYILDRKPWKYLLVVLVAGLFHVSAYLMLLLYFLPRRRLSLVTGGLVMLMAALTTEAYGRILDVVVVFRQEADFGGVDSYFYEELDPLRVAVAVVPLVFYLVFTRKDALRSDDHFYVHMLLLNAGVFIASSGSAYIARFAVYTGIFTCLALPRLLTTRDRSERALFVLAIASLYFAFWYIETTGLPELYNFRWIWQREGGP